MVATQTKVTSAHGSDNLPTMDTLAIAKTKMGDVCLTVKHDDELFTRKMQIHLIWSDYPSALRAHIKKKKLKGGYWRTPKLEHAMTIKCLINHELGEDGTVTRYQILWDNGAEEWVNQSVVESDVPAAWIKKYNKDRKLS